MTTPKEKYLSSQEESAEMIWDMAWEGDFSNTDHLLALRKENSDRQENRDNANDATIKVLVGDIIVTNRCLILRTKNTGA